MIRITTLSVLLTNQSFSCCSNFHALVVRTLQLLECIRSTSVGWRPDSRAVILSASLLIFSGCGEDASAPEQTASSASSEESAAPDMSTEDYDMEMAGGEMEAPDESAYTESEGAPSSGDGSEMYEEYAGMEPGSEGYPGGETGKPKRPEKVEEWTAEQLVEAIASSDQKTPAAIDHVVKSFKGDASDVELIDSWIAALSKAPAAQSSQYGEMEMYNMQGQSAGGQTPVKQQISRKLLDLLFANKTPASFASIQKILTGESSLGVPQEKAEEWIIGHLMQRAGQADKSAQALLWTALNTPPAQVPEPKSDGEKSDGAPQIELDAPMGETGGQQNKPSVSLPERVRQYHIGFLVAAMNEVLGVPGRAQSQPRNNQYGSGESMYPGTGEYGEMGGNQQQAAPRAKPMNIMPVVLEDGQIDDALNYLWSAEMVGFASKQLAEHPESTEALVMAASLPAKTTRAAVKSLFEAHQDQPPQKWLDQNVFGEQLLDPAIHLIVKSLEREQRPQQANAGGGEGAYGESGGAAAQPPRRPRPGAKKPKEPTPEELAELEASYGWMEAAEKTLVANLDRMYAASLRKDAVAVDEKELAFSLHTGAEITNSVKFQLPSQQHPVLQTAAPVTVNYVRIESPLLNQRTLQFYQSKLKDEVQNTILNGNGLWLDAPVRLNHRTNQLLSADVLISRNNARPTRTTQRPSEGEAAGEAGPAYESGGGSGGGEGQTYVVEILTIEVPDDGNTVSSNN